MKKLFTRICLLLLLSLGIVVSSRAQSVVFTSLQGTSSTFTKGAGSVVAYGFSMFVPAGGSFSGGVLNIGMTQSINGFATNPATLVRVASADPTLATTAQLNTYSLTINGTGNNALSISSWPTFTGAATTGTTYYFYALIDYNTSNNGGQPNAYQFYIPPSGSVTQNTYSGGITVNNTNSKTFNFSTSPPIFTYTSQVLTVGVPMTPVSPNNTGGTSTGASSSPSLPAGLTINSAGVISGTPSAVSAATNYTITLSNANGSNPGTVNITVNPAPPTISYTTPLTYTVGTAIATLIPTTSGSPTGYSTTGLPAGLSFNTTNGQITGTPTTVSAAANYSVTATNAGGNANTSINITVNAGTATVTTTTPVTNIYGGSATVGGAITAINGANVTEYGIVYSTSATTPTTANSKFIMGSAATGALTFSSTLEWLAPNTVYYTRAYAVNSAGTSYGAVVSFTTMAAPAITYSTPQVYIAGTAITTLSPANTGGAVPATTYLSSSNFGSGYSTPYSFAFDNAGFVYVLDGLASKVWKVPVAGGTPVQIGPTFTLASIAGMAVDATGNIYVADQVNNIIYKINPAGTRTTFINSGLSGPSALVFDSAQNLYVANYISGDVFKIAYGTSTLSPYATGLAGAYGLAFNSAGVLHVAERDDVVPYAGGIYKIPAGGGAATQLGTVTSNFRNLDIDAAGNVYAADFANNKIIKVTSAGVASDFITGLTTPRGVTLDATGNMFIADGANVKKVLLGGYTISPTSLPAGLSFNATTGVISGNATAVSAATIYTITAYNSAGSSVTTLSIAVNPATPTVTLGTPVPICGASTESMTAASGYPTGGTYNWYLVSTGGTAQVSTANYTPFVGGTTTFYVDYTVSGITSARVAVPITITPRISSSITSEVIAWPFSGNSNDISGNANHGLPQNSPALATDRNGVANGAYTFNGTNTFIVQTNNFPNPPMVFSYSLWFKTSVITGMLADFGGSQLSAANATKDRQLYMSTGGTLTFGVYSGSARLITTSGTNYADGLWHHAVVTCGPTAGLNLYVDGVVRATSAYFQPQNNSGYWRVGGDATGAGFTGATGNYFNGQLDDFVVFNKELSATDVALSSSSSVNDMNLYGFSSSYCANNPVTITAPSIAGATYAWVDNSNAAYTSSTNPATFPVATTSSYQLTVTVNGCSSVSTVTPITPTYIWTGLGGTTADNLNANWTSSVTGGITAPSFSGTESLEIPAGASVYPVLGANRSIYSLTLGAGASLTLGTNTLNIGCNIINNNSTTNSIISSSASGAIVNWNGTLLSQSYTGANATLPVQLDRMTINNTNASTGTVTLSGGLIDVYTALTLTAGKLDIGSTATVTLKSTSALTASIPAITSPSTITGKIIAERYLSGFNRGYRLISSPVATTTLLNTPSSGINSFDMKEVIKNSYISGPGTMSGSPVLGTSVNSNGFDYSPLNNPSIFIYKESDPNPASINIVGSEYKGFASMNEYVPMGNGVLFFMRGDRTLSQAGNTSGNAFVSPYPFANTTTLKFAGTVISGDVPVYLPSFKSSVSYYNVTGMATGLSAGVTTLNATPFVTSMSYTANAGNKNGFNLVGNPYPSTIDIEKIAFTGAGFTTIGVYTLNKNNTYSLYVRNAATNTVGTTTGTSANGGSRYIVSGQGFFVKSVSTAAALTFKESSKTTYPTGLGLTGVPNVFSLTNSKPLLRVKLVQDSVYYNETLFTFGDNHANKYDEKEDIPYLGAPTQTIFLYSVTDDDNTLVYNQMSSLEKITSPIKLFASGSTTGIYKLEFAGTNTIDPYYRIFLKDAYTKDSLEVTANNTYTFNINRAVAATYGANRFTLVVHHSILGAYQLVKFTGDKTVGSAIKLTWETKNESSVITFNVERSTDGGKTFTDLGMVQSSGKGTYSFTDASPAAQTDNIYRLKQADVNDAISYSPLVSIAPEKVIGVQASTIVVYPNPAVERISVDVSAKVTTAVELQIVNSSGKVVKKATFAPAQHFEQAVSDVLPGSYIIDLVETGTKRKVATTKFIKL